MNRIKTPNVAGKFYTSIKAELLETLEKFKSNHKSDYNYFSRAIIVPHAGYMFSGQLAFDGFCRLDKNVKNIFIIAPTHHKSVNNLALANYDEWETPLGKVSVNKNIQEEIISQFGCEYSDKAFAEEHAIEVQIPFIQFNYKDIKIIPILVGNDDVEKTLRIIKYYYVNPQNAFVISSDLSHFLKEAEAKKIDTLTARMIEEKNMQGFRFEQACGAVPICALTEFANQKNFSLIRIGLTNSAKATGDNSKVVGYGSWFLFEGEKNEFIEKNFSPKIIDIVKKTINAKLSGKTEINITNYMPYPPILDSDGACFVTLEENNILRGCIGSVIAHSPLIIDLIKNAYNAAFADPRFAPLSREEFEQISISVSLLSIPNLIKFEDEQDLLEQINPFVDGIIIKDKQKQALYLPSVWEQLPDKKLFLNSLKQKAGFAPNYFSKTIEAYRFKTNYIKENNFEK